MIKVLVVDDDKLARKGIISLIHEGNYNMQVVGDVQNGRVALEFLEKEMVDLIFVDIDMPEMTGLELMHICKERFPKIKFVVLTFYEEFNYIQQALRLGALDYISKLRRLFCNSWGRIF
ncbi:MAG: response regulator [Clostridiaceae bacterium]|nr:response regulator [Clostridiaceae bacterium]